MKPTSPNPAEGTKNLEPRVEPEEELVKPSGEPEFATPILTYANDIFETWTEESDDASGDGA
ncbi:hypothetical protein J1N35_035768 [Gossypium stocksii]|uniref:Uncharacterized protein n=1 Tax=Gossypium stocksii TaxID=47602 RepID=A0A9D3UUN1_9ROSI|nr:hypothetical protein J1N35_035768 [Gossypium stocksii]